MFYEDSYLGQPAAPAPSHGTLPNDASAGGARGGSRRSKRTAGAALAAIAVVAAGAGLGGLLTTTAVAAGGTSAATLSVSQVEAKVDPALVDIVTSVDYGQGEAAGTGMVLASTGEVLTNNHVVEGATTIRVTDVGNAKTYSARVVGYDTVADVAVLQLKGASGLKTVTVANSGNVGAGASVVALGNAGGVGGIPSAATGTITALGQSIAAADQMTGTAEQLHGLIATDANIQAGDSGGPLVDMKGAVIGMDTAGSSAFQFQAGNGAGAGPQGSQATTGYAVPVNTAVALARQIEGGRSSTAVHIGESAFLGVQVANTDGSYEQSSPSNGAQIEGVVPGSPAASSGLATYDTITSIGGHPVTSFSGLQAVINQLHPGQRVSVTWVGPYGASHTSKVTLASGPVG